MLRTYFDRLVRYGSVVFLAAAVVGCSGLPTEPTGSTALSTSMGSSELSARAPAPEPASTIALVAPASLTEAAAAEGASLAAWPTLGDWVAFKTSYSSKYDRYGVRIQLVCTQDGHVVYGAAHPKDEDFLLGGASSDWLTLGGPATCKADLYYWSYKGQQVFNLLATTSFEVF